MKKNKLAILLIVILLILTAAAAAVYLSTRPAPVEGAVTVAYNGSSVDLPLSKLKFERVQGEMRTNKGEVRQIDAQGVRLADTLRAAKIQPENCSGAEVTADDGYHAQVDREELLSPDRVYLLLEEDHTVRMMVFGDSNSKRNVSGVVRIEVLP